MTEELNLKMNSYLQFLLVLTLSFLTKQGVENFEIIHV